MAQAVVREMPTFSIPCNFIRATTLDRMLHQQDVRSRNEVEQIGLFDDPPHTSSSSKTDIARHEATDLLRQFTTGACQPHGQTRAS